MEYIIGNRVVIIAHQDVDAVCTVKILTNLFKTEGVSYILLSCSGISDMKAKYDEYSGQSNWFIMVNCGATVDLLHVLGDPPMSKNFFILDYHRPIHIINYYNTTNQIRLVSVPEDDDRIPTFDQIFGEDPVSDDSDSDEEMDFDDEMDENGISASMRRREGRRQRRAEHADWLKTRERLLFNYREYSYYARPVSSYNVVV